MCGRRIAGLIFLLSVRLAGQHGSTTAVNPYTGSEHAAAGAQLFRAQCAACHGAEGTGSGKGPDLTSGTFRHGGSDEALFQTITTGVPGTSMPGFRLTGLQTWQLVTHLRSLNVQRGSALVKGNAVEGGRVFKASCSGCHAVSGQGALIGPDLTGIGARRSVAELRKALLEPDADVPAEHWSVAIRTKSGQKLAGVRLNEDTHSIQLRDAQGRLTSVLRSEVAEAELMRRSPMPSFASKLPEEQINNVLAYLTTLRGDR
jgi:putative heme-binding domain-containing protein